MDIGGGMRDIGGSMNRRQFLSSSGAVLALGCGVEVSAAAATVTEQAASSSVVPKRALMNLGCQSAPTNDAHLKYLARYGVQHICGYPETSEGASIRRSIS
jgi:mannonate dehydratase